MAEESAPPRVLVVEDESIVALDIEFRLRRLGCHVVGHTRSGSEAIAMARSERPDLILMDFKLDGPVTGLDAARAIHAERPVPILFVSGHRPSLVEGIAHDLSVGVLSKPFDDAEFERVIRLCLGRSA